MEHLIRASESQQHRQWPLFPPLIGTEMKAQAASAAYFFSEGFAIHQIWRRPTNIPMREANRAKRQHPCRRPRAGHGALDQSHQLLDERLRPHQPGAVAFRQQPEPLTLDDVTRSASGGLCGVDAQSPRCARSPRTGPYGEYERPWSRTSPTEFAPISIATTIGIMRRVLAPLMAASSIEVKLRGGASHHSHQPDI